MQEIEILSKLDHPYILKIFEWKEDESNIFIVTEYLKYGSLYEKIKREGYLTEKDSKIIMRKIL